MEVAAAAEKEKKPKAIQQAAAMRETLWGKKRNVDSPRESTKRKGGKLNSSTYNEIPAQNFSQAYELFVRGFDAKKMKPNS